MINLPKLDIKDHTLFIVKCDVKYCEHEYIAGLNVNLIVEDKVEIERYQALNDFSEKILYSYEYISYSIKCPNCGYIKPIGFKNKPKELKIKEKPTFEEELINMYFGC